MDCAGKGHTKTLYPFERHLRYSLSENNEAFTGFVEDTTVESNGSCLTRLSKRGGSVIMGVLNVTPDSFLDGGSFLERDKAVAHGRKLLEAGADIIDVGGESTRPGANRVPADEELSRVIPVVSELASGGAAVSIDTTRAQVAEAAVSSGARIVNDVSGGLADPLMPKFVAAAGVPYVVMHWRPQRGDAGFRTIR